jgi:hypothetical protein
MVVASWILHTHRRSVSPGQASSCGDSQSIEITEREKSVLLFIVADTQATLQEGANASDAPCH